MPWENTFPERGNQRTIMSRGKWKQGFRKAHWWPFSKELFNLWFPTPNPCFPFPLNSVKLLLHHFKETAPQASITSELWNLTLDPSPPLTSKPAPLHADIDILPCDRVKHLSFSQFPSWGGPIFHNTARISHCIPTATSGPATFISAWALPCLLAGPHVLSHSSLPLVYSQGSGQKGPFDT